MLLPYPKDKAYHMEHFTKGTVFDIPVNRNEQGFQRQARGQIRRISCSHRKRRCHQRGLYSCEGDSLKSVSPVNKQYHLKLDSDSHDTYTIPACRYYRGILKVLAWLRFLQVSINICTVSLPPCVFTWHFPYCQHKLKRVQKITA